MQSSLIVSINKIWFTIILWLLIFSGSAQNIETSLTTLAGTKGQLPFWLWANQLGRYDRNSNTIQNFEFSADYNSTIKKSDFSFQSGICTNFLLMDKNTIHITELFGGLDWKFLQLKIGSFAEEQMYNGLSASNGNLAYSQNARPHPRIKIGLNRYLPIISNWLSVYGMYEEGILNDSRFVDATHLHHKSLYFRFGSHGRLQISAGIEHYVMWGGTHPEFGELLGWKDYIKAITGKPGGINTPSTEQQNAEGNSYGTYQIEIKKAWDKVLANLYVSHPYDDRSGLELENWRDNLYGLFIRINKNTPFIKTLVFEYYHTKHQSGSYHLKPRPDGTNSGRGVDNYFNHGIYSSGVTYHQMAMVSPLISPIIINDNISMGFENNRITGLHLGADGFIGSTLRWRTLLTKTSNFGQYNWDESASYSPVRKQLSTLFQLVWPLPQKPISLSTSFAVDKGELYDKGERTSRIGGMLSIRWQINH